MNLMNIDVLLSVALGLAVVSFVGVVLSISRQKSAFAKVKEGIRLQSQANRHLENMLKELRRSNKLLGQLADDEYEEVATVTTTTEEPLRESHKLYVGNIDYSVNESELEEYFSPYGEIESVNIPVNRYNGKTRGFGFVTFVSKEDANKAMVLNSTEFKGREIQVNFAKEREAS